MGRQAADKGIGAGDIGLGPVLPGDDFQLWELMLQHRQSFLEQG